MGLNRHCQVLLARPLQLSRRSIGAAALAALLCPCIAAGGASTRSSMAAVGAHMSVADFYQKTHAMEAPSDAVRTLLMRKKREQGGGAPPAPSEMEFAYRPPPAGQKRARPEDAVPDYPQNRAVREYLKKAGSKGGKVELGEGTVMNQCWRCKLFGHRTGDRSCPYFTVGNLEAEAERQIREDPAVAIEQRTGRARAVVGGGEAKLRELQELMESVRRAEEERKERKRQKKEKKKKKKKEKKKRSFREEGDVIIL